MPKKEVKEITTKKVWMTPLGDEGYVTKIVNTKTGKIEGEGHDRNKSRSSEKAWTNRRERRAR